jgi:hypothetical protein
MSDPAISVTSNNQSGGITAYQVFIGNVNLTFTEATAEKVASLLPKNNPIDVVVVGSSADQKVGEQYINFLAKKGFVVRGRSSAGVMAPPPDDKISIVVRPESSFLTIAPRA